MKGDNKLPESADDRSTSSGGRELKGYQSGDGYERHVVDLLGRSGIEMDYSLFLYSNHPTSRPARDV